MTLRTASFAYCTCGGVWLPFGQLELVLGEALHSEPLGGETTRRCPDCTLTLTTVVLAGGVPVELCSACRGTWLDWHDVIELRVKDLEAAVRPAPAQRYAPFTSPDPGPSASTTGFLCAKCSTRTEFARGHAGPHGLICGNCVANVQPLPRIPDLISELPDLEDLD